MSHFRPEEKNRKSDKNYCCPDRRELYIMYNKHVQFTP